MKRMIWKQMFCVGLCLVLVLFCLASCKKSEAMSMEADKGASESVTNSSGTGGKPSYDQLSDSMDGEPKENPVKIIRTVKLHAESQHFEEATALIQQTVSELGGYVGSSTVQGAGISPKAGRSRYAEYTLRIPAEKLDAFLSTVGNTLHVTSTESTAEDVTNEYYDMEARLSVLEAERKVLEKMLSESTNVSNMITLEQRLYDVIGEIESYQSALRVYDNKVSYSTVTLHLNEVVELTVEEEGFGARIKRALSETWENLAKGGQDCLISLIYGLPVLIALAVIGGTVCVVILTTAKRRKKRKTKKQGDESHL
jgi:hypothetical protein